MPPPDPDADSLPAISSSLLNSAFNNILHHLLIHRHRQHKLLLASLDPITKLPHCERCNLPKLLEPPLAPAVRGSATHPPADTQYCDRRPWCRRPGFDIYGNPFPKADLTGRPPSKKEREAAANQNKKNPDGTPASNEGGTAPPSPTPQESAATEKLEKGEKKASKIDEKLKKGEYVPWQTCPNCKRSLLITRFAKHLEGCMDLGNKGRAAARNAMAKMNGTGSGQSGTPAGSRGGTPAPEINGVGGSGGVGEDDEDDERVKGNGNGGVRKKVLKKGLNSKLSRTSTSTSNAKSGKDATTNGVTKLSTGTADTLSKRDFDSFIDSDGAANDDEGDNVHVKKRQKLARVESTASFASTAQSVEMERTESQDGAWVGDGSSLIDGEGEDSD